MHIKNVVCLELSRTINHFKVDLASRKIVAFQKLRSAKEASFKTTVVENYFTFTVYHTNWKWRFGDITFHGKFKIFMIIQSYST